MLWEQEVAGSNPATPTHESLARNCRAFFYLELAEKLRIIIFRCAAPPISILTDISTKIIATLWLDIQVRSTGNLCRILSGDGDKGAAHRDIWCKVFE